jgi:hypothetical protein
MFATMLGVYCFIQMTTNGAWLLVAVASSANRRHGSTLYETTFIKRRGNNLEKQSHPTTNLMR